MKRLLLSLIAVLTLPLAVNADGIDPEVHKLCLPAKDYAGCIKFQTKNKNTKLIGHTLIMKMRLAEKLLLKHL